MPLAAHLVPVLADLPGDGWRVVELPGGDGPAGDAEVMDCVGDDFPRPAEVADSATSAHFVRRRQLVHGLSVVFRTDGAAARAADSLRRSSFAACLGRSVAADLGADPDGPEVLAVDVAGGGPPHRVRFAGAGPAGVLTVHLDIVVLREGAGVTLLWFGDAPQPFPPDARRHVVERLAGRLANGAAGR